MDLFQSARDSIIRTGDRERSGDDSRALRRLAATGSLLKLRRGAYVPMDRWTALSDRDRHLLRIAAVLSDASGQREVGGPSAAAVWGMPVLAFPDEVTVADVWHGGGRSSPGVRRVSAGWSTRRLVDVDGFRLTDITRTALAMTRHSPFVHAVGCVDWALWNQNPLRVSKRDLFDDLSNLSSRFGVARASRVVEFASELSDSFGESMCRAVIHECGFEPPMLQRVFRDGEGMMRVDFYWPSVGVVGEFDGRSKYGVAPNVGRDVLWREKLRQDRLRTMVATVTRLVWSDVVEPPRLVEKLLAVGVPRHWR
jgi:hypothetical protein